MDQVTPTTQSSQPNLPSNRFHLFSISLCFLFILSSLYLFSQNLQLKKQVTILQNSLTPPNPTDPTDNLLINWKAYTDAKYNFSFKYPDDFKQGTVVAEDEIPITNYEVWLSKDGPTQKNQNEFYDGISMRFLPNILNNQTLEQWFDNKIKDDERRYISTKKSILFNQYSGFEIYEFDDENIYRHLVIQSNIYQKNIVEIFIVIRGSLSNEFNQTANQILSTFTFNGGKDDTACNVNGKTYQSGETFPDKCNSCSCENGQIACTLMACE